MPLKILIAENEPNLLELMTLFLRKSGYQIEHAHTGKDAQHVCECYKPHLIIIGNTLPDMSALALCEKMSRRSSRAHVLMSDGASKEAVIQAFKHGADDYFVKPFDLDVFLVRIGALARRLSHQNIYTEPTSKNIRFDSFNNNVLFQNTMVHLTQTEFKILFHLYQSKKYISAEELTGELYGNKDLSVPTRTISVHIAKLRKKMKSAGVSWAAIESKYNTGYRFISE